MLTKTVMALRPTVLRVVEDEREVARKVKAGDGPFEIPFDDFHGLRNTGRVEEVAATAPAPTPKQRAKARAATAAGQGKSKAKAAAKEPVAKDPAAA